MQVLSARSPHARNLKNHTVESSLKFSSWNGANEYTFIAGMDGRRFYFTLSKEDALDMFESFSFAINDSKT